MSCMPLRDKNNIELFSRMQRTKQVWLTSSFLNWLNLLNDIVNLDQLHEAIMILWELWNARNSLVWHQRPLQPKVVIQKLALFWQD